MSLAITLLIGNTSYHNTENTQRRKRLLQQSTLQITKRENVKVITNASTKCLIRSINNSTLAKSPNKFPRFHLTQIQLFQGITCTSKQRMKASQGDDRSRSHYLTNGCSTISRHFMPRLEKGEEERG